MSLLQNSNAISSGGYNLESSLRFRGGQNLTRTITSASNRRTYTQSVWLKRGAIGTSPYIFNQYLDSNTNSLWYFNASSSEAFNVFNRIGGTNYQVQTSASFRDPSAWYHIVVATDTTQATASNRIKIWINGEQVTSFSATGYPPQNSDTAINSASTYYIGSGFAPSQFFDGYITEWNFVDGQALTPSDFGEYDTTTGVWKPKEYTGTYGTNGFYLPMKETQQATGFNTVLYDGTGATQSITGVGFSPDLVWTKTRNVSDNHVLQDAVRGAGYRLFSDLTNAESYQSTALTSFDSDGFSLGSHVSVNTSGRTYVAWCWDAGSSTVSNTDGTITSSVRANPDSGFSIVSWTSGGTTSTETVGHGMGSTPSMIILKNRDLSDNWWVWHNTFSNPQYNYLNLNGTGAVSTNINPMWGASGAMTSSTFGIREAGFASSGQKLIAYCFSEVSGYSKFGSYTGTSGDITVNCGFRPAFVMVKNTSSTGNWEIHDNTRHPSVATDTGYSARLRANDNSAEASFNNSPINFTDTGFVLDSSVTGNSYVDYDNNGNTYIYMAFADTRDAQFNFDASGNKNNWTANNINSNASSETTYDIMNDVATLTDEDTANFATWNPLDRIATTYSEANLKAVSSSNTGAPYNIQSTIKIPNTGKFYWEITAIKGTGNPIIGIGNNSPIDQWAGYRTSAVYLSGNISGVSLSGTPASYTTNDVIGVAYDVDSGTLSFYKNGVAQSGGLTNIPASEYFAIVRVDSSSGDGGYLNCGQRPFKYTPPIGYKKLNTYNLPDSTIVDGSQYMNTVTYTGTGTTNSITGVGFSPDLLWLKDRTVANSHNVFDTVRGIGASNSQRLVTNTTDAETTYSTITSVNSDGFVLGDGLGNQSGNSNVAWVWRGSDSSAVSNTDGTITSTVSANTTSGFSVVTYTGNATSGANVGHGLGVTPDLIIIKNRSAATNWAVIPGNSTLFGGSYYLMLNDFSPRLANSNMYSTYPTSTKFYLSTSSMANGSGNNMVAYCFASVEGFSQIGKYTGNGSADGPFIYTGFRPAFIMTKNITGSNAHWVIYDTTRDPSNALSSLIYPSLNNAEGSTAVHDSVSNGFKVRYAGGSAINTSGVDYLYMAFAENPFKQSLAR